MSALRSLALSLLVAQESPAPPAAAPRSDAPVNLVPVNLVIVTLDTVRADHVGCYGYFRETTPHLDALAKECLRFTRCLAPLAHTTPSHCSLFTGVYPFEHGVLSNFFTRPDDERRVLALRTSPTLRTLAQSLQARGWRTGGFVGSTPVKRFTGLSAGFDEWSEPADSRRVGAEVVADALRFVDDKGDGGKGAGERPFFLWVHLFDAHGPIAPPKFPPKSYLERFRTDPALVAWLRERRFPDSVAGEHTGEIQPTTAHNYYDGALRFLDDQLDVLLQRLRRDDLWNRTAIVIVADHGQGLGQHGFLGHGTCFDEQLRVPLLMHAPGVAAAVVDVPCATIDVLPTLFALAPGLADPELARQWRGADVLAASHEPRALFSMGPVESELTALTTPRWKLLRRGATVQLFDLEADPHELENVAAAHQDVASALVRRLDAEIARQRQSETLHHSGRAGADAAGELDPKILEELRALGYGAGGENESAGPPKSGGD